MAGVGVSTNPRPTKKGGKEMPELTIKISPDVSGKLKSVQQRVNQNLAPAIEKGLERRVSKEQIAAALVEVGLSKTKTKLGKIVFATMVAVEQLREKL